MNSPSDREQLLMRYLDGRLSTDETRAVSAWLREDAAARAWLRELSEQAVAFGDLAREQSWRAPVAASAPAKVISPRFTQPAWLALAAALAVLVGGAAFWFGGRHAALRMVVEVEDVTGALNWTGPTGELRPGLARAARVAAGTFATAGEGATAQLRFADGTRVTLGSGAQVAVADDGQKRLHLQGGPLAAEVRPQPEGRPLLLRTDAAALELPDSICAIAAEEGETSVRVSAGRVRLRRLADDTILELTGQQTAVATLNQTEQLRRPAPVAPPTEWHAELTGPPPASWKAQWHPTTAVAPALLRAVPCVAGQRADGMPVFHHGISVRKAGGHLARVAPASQLRLRWRTTAPAPLRVMLGLQKLDGRFGGNFEARLTAGEIAPGPDGWQELGIPLAQLHANGANHPAPPESALLALVFVNTYEHAAGLEVAELSILPANPVRP